MSQSEDLKTINTLVKAAQKVVIIMADNPDGDSIASGLALEHILGDMGKDVHLYCGVDLMPNHFAHLPGWDRVSKELPSSFDLSIMVDCSVIRLLELLDKTGQLGWVKSRPMIVLDHHDLESDVDFAKVIYNQHSAVATGEVIYEIASTLQWPLSLEAKNMLAASILSDSLGLMTEGTTARSIEIIAALVKDGVKLFELEDARRMLMKKSPDLLKYKGRLIERIEYYSDDRIATVTIPWEEIEAYSHAYNPSMLVLDEMRYVENVRVAVAFKLYNNGRITAKIRCNSNGPIAAELARSFGGDGHKFASGFKITDKQDFASVKAACIARATELLDSLND